MEQGIELVVIAQTAQIGFARIKEVQAQFEEQRRAMRGRIEQLEKEILHLRNDLKEAKRIAEERGRGGAS